MGKSENKKNNFYGKLVIIALLVISIGSYFLVPSVKATTDRTKYLLCLKVEILQ